MKHNLKINLTKQIEILKKANQFLNNKNNKYFDSSINYLDSVEQNPGYGLIQLWNKGIKKIPLFELINKLLIKKSGNKLK